MALCVMIVEDDPFIALDMESVVEDAGYDVLGPIATTPEAVKLLSVDDASKLPDCALLDYYISGGTSEFIARELTRLDIPFVYLTGNSHDVRQSLSDLDPVIRTKPVRPKVVVQDIQTLIAA